MNAKRVKKKAIVEEDEGFSGEELVTHVQYISRDKDIEINDVFRAVEESLAIAFRRADLELRLATFRVEVNRDTGDLRIFRQWQIMDIDEITNDSSELTCEDAQQDFGKEFAVGDVHEIEIPTDDYNFFRRTVIQVARQNLNQKLRQIEHQKYLHELIAQNEKLLSGQVQRVDRVTGDIYIDVMRVECILEQSEMIPREMLKPDDRVQVLIKRIEEEENYSRLYVTRRGPDFLIELFRRTVPEIEKGILEIVGAVRDPGNRAKIAVRTNDPRVDPVGTCIGIRGSRVQSVTNEINGERVDIIPRHEDEMQFVIAALSPAKISEIIMDEEKHALDILVDSENLAQAIGRNGFNVRLASELTGWKLNLISPEDYEKNQQEEVEKNSAIFADKLGIEADLARILYEEGFMRLEDIAYIEPTELLSIEGFDAQMVEEIQKRAVAAVELIEEEFQQRLSDAPTDFVDLFEQARDDPNCHLLVRNGICSLDDLAQLSVDDLLESTALEDKALALELVTRAKEIVYQEIE